MTTRSNEFEGLEKYDLVILPQIALENLYYEVKTIIGSEKLSSANSVMIVLSLMQIVETYDNIKGVQKKVLILRTLYRLVNNTIEDRKEALNLKLLIQMTLPDIIDSFVSIDRQELQIKIKKGCQRLFCCC